MRDGGLRAGLAHIFARILGDPRFLRPASSIDFRHFGLESSPTLNDFIGHLIPEKSSIEIENALRESITGIDFFHELPNEIENSLESKVNLEDWEL